MLLGVMMVLRTKYIEFEGELELVGDFMGLFLFFRKSLIDQICCANGKAVGVNGTEKISHE